MAHEDDLRAWAKGMHTIEAATELLIRAFGGRYAAVGRPWIRKDGSDGKPWIDFEVIPECIGGSSGGERRFLMLAASLADNVPVVLSDTIPGMDRENLDLVLAAIAHAGGSHEHSDKLGSLYPWPRSLDSV
ncbi:hypothetical protein [Arthrobacter mobilis]|uniref:Uncharacterized protein n=1 Tax=Arthrobacter mobilis TaxID=2724944 RepID=A0A7X6HF64_9MICC|nr:hypothetical protein [Arthrobacter mobilis]NKX55921.1 hypothetical protein [Arthrobacter mobilis]